MLIASFGGVKSGDQTIVNDAVQDKMNYILGFSFTTIGMWLSTCLETAMPNKYALIGILLMTTFWFLLGLVFDLLY